MEEKELNQEEVQESELEENEEQENESQETETEESQEQEYVNESQEEVEELKVRPIREWDKANLGSKSKDIALITFFGSTLLRSFSGYFSSSIESQKLFLSMYIYIPGVLALLGLIIGLIAVIKSKAKWDSVVGMLLNLFLITSSVLIFVQMRQAGY